MSSLPFATEEEIQPWPAGFRLFDEQQQEEEIVELWIQEVIGFSSQYGSRNSSWTASQVVGPPRVQRYGDDPLAWAAASVGTGNEYLELKWAQPVQIQRVRIHESLCGGAFCKLQLRHPQTSQYVTVVEQTPRCGQYPREMRVEDIQVPQQADGDDNDDDVTSFATDTLRLEFNQRGANTWYEVDAVQVVGSVKPISCRDNVAPFRHRQQALANDIATLFQDATTADCTLVAATMDNIGTNSNGNSIVRIPVHRGILASRCPLFRKMLDNSELPLGGDKAILGLDAKLLQLLLEWIYTGKLDDDHFEKCDCIALATASDYFQLDSLTAYCLKIFKTVLTVDNAAQLYAHFDSISVYIIEPLKQAVLEFCGTHFVQVSQTQEFQELTQLQLLAVIECYGNLKDPSSEKRKAEA